MNSQDIQKPPGFKRLQKLMEDPRYWKQQDPAYVEMIRQGFRDLHDTPVEAGLAANEAGVNGKIHAQDDEVAHVTRGEVVIPLSAQTPEVMKMLYQTLGKDMIKYTVGSGHEQRNPTSGLAAFADDKSWHFEERDAKNIYLPENLNDVRQRGSKWEEYPASQNVFHDDGKGAPERKFSHPDGREAVYDGDTGKLVTDKRRRGTFNYTNPWNNNREPQSFGEEVEKVKSYIGHARQDIYPWLVNGNDRGDESPVWEIIRKRFSK